LFSFCLSWFPGWDAINLTKEKLMPGIVVHAYNPSTERLMQEDQEFKPVVDCVVSKGLYLSGPQFPNP
jgi:hypothetical protein